MADRWETGRLEAFSDGVLAIAITLLVLELSVPEADFEHLWRGIADQWPSYLAYATSFMTIGAIWLVHHGMFRRLAFADGLITRLNLLLLMFASFLPFPTKLVAEAVDSGHGERPAVMFYGLVLLAISTVLTVMWRHIAATATCSNARIVGQRGRRDHAADDAQHRVLRSDRPARADRADGRRVRLPRHRRARRLPQPRGLHRGHIRTGLLNPPPDTCRQPRERNHGTPSQPQRRAGRPALPDAGEARLDRRRRVDRGRPGREGLQGRRQGAARPRHLQARRSRRQRGRQDPGDASSASATR